jgi:GTPase SAR1 family protein
VGVSQRVNVKQAIDAINEMVIAKQGRHLEEPEKVVIEAAWLDLDYQEIAQQVPYSVDILQRRTAPKLWILLTGILGNGEKVTKKRLRSILERRMDVTSSKVGMDSSNEIHTSSAIALPRVLGGQPPDTSNFYGRTAELSSLKEWIVQKRCIVLHGVVGVGKTTLAARLVEEVSTNAQSQFDCAVWKSLAYAPLLPDLVTELVKLCNFSNLELELPEYTQARISLLLERLRSRRILLILDAAEAILQGDRNSRSNPYGEQYAEYGLFFRRLVEEQHQSCILLTSQEPFSDLTLLESAKRPVRSVKVEGLDLDSGMQFLHSKGLTDTNECQELIQTYRGNPSELEAVANRIQHFFGGSAKSFLEYKTTLIGDSFQAKLNQIFGQARFLSQLQRQIAIYLAEEQSKGFTSIAFTRLLSSLSSSQQDPISTSELIEALEGLEKCSLIETSKHPNSQELSFALQPVVKKYILTDPFSLVRQFNNTSKPA